MRLRAEPASDDDRPWVMGGMSCCRNGELCGRDVIMLIVFWAMVVITLLLVSGGVLLSVCNSDGEGGGVFS